MHYVDAMEIIDAIDATNYVPSEWEEKFMKSITHNDRNLSEKQSACLSKIYANASGGSKFERKQYFRR